MGNFSSPDALAVWMIPTKVISWDVSLSNLILSLSILPDVLWLSNIPYAIVPLQASSFVMFFPVFAAMADKASGVSGMISVPLSKYAPVGDNETILWDLLFRVVVGNK